MWERNAADDTFGFGVVFSDETLGGIEHADRADLRADAARVRALGRHRRALPRPGAHQRRPRLRRDEPQTAAGDPAGALRRVSGVTLHFSTPAPDVDELAADHDLVVACDGAQLRPSASGTRRCSGPTWRRGAAGTCGSAPSKVFDAFTFHVRETPHGVMQIHGYPYDATGSTFIVEMPTRCGTGPASTHWPTASSGRASPTRSRSRRSASCSPTCSTATTCMANNSRWLSFATVRNRTLAPRQRRAAGRRRAHRALLDRLGHQAGDGGRAGAGRLPARAARRRRGAGGVRGRAPARRASRRSARRRRAWSGSRTSGSTSTRIRVQFAFNIMTRSRRVTYDNLRVRDPEFVDARRHVVRRHEARGTARRGPAADVPAVPAARAGAGQPGRGLGDGHVRRAGRGARRLPPRPPRRQGARRRRPGDDRDGLRVRHRADHPGLRGSLDRRAGAPPGGASPSSCTRSRPRRSASSWATPAARAPPG